ncbi:MAG: CDP-alcohol phosphatidyltransferase family protein [Acidobacteriota bacterium]
MMSASTEAAVPVKVNPEFKNAVRFQQSLLTRVERKCLAWLAQRMPARVNSDHLTLLGFAAMFVAGLCYWAARWWPGALLLVNLMLAVNWFGDSLDGTLARARNKLRPRYGFYVDHMADAFGIFFLMCGLAASGYMSLTVALGVLVVYFLLSIDVYLATYTLGTFKMSFYKFGPTELRILLAIGNIKAMVGPTVRVFGERHLFFDVGAIVAMALLGMVVIVSAIGNTMTLYRAEKV